MSLGIAVIISLLLHLSVFFAGHTKKDTGGNLKANSPDGNFIEKEKEPIKIRITSSGHGIKIPPKKNNIKKDCKISYFGIGYQTRAVVDDWCIIGTIAPDSPLNRIGVTVGDQIYTDSGECPGQGPENTEVTIVLRQNGSTRILTFKREKICMDE